MRVESGTVVAVGEMVNGRFVPSAIGYWRYLEHEDGGMISIAPEWCNDEIGEAVAVDYNTMESVAEVAGQLRDHDNGVARALFGDPEAGDSSGVEGRITEDPRRRRQRD